MTEAKCHKLLNVLCPMHVVFDPTGTVTHAGPTAQKICPHGLIGRSFLDVFEIKRPRKISTLQDLCDRKAVRLNLQLRDSPHRQLKGVLIHGPGPEEVTVNLSFGISIVDAVADYKLTAADFAATDLTVEMLYLVEAKSAAMEASRQLNERLRAAREEAEERAMTDTLTGLRNRRAMDYELAETINQAQPFALMHADLDYFKLVNDTLGHAAGDFVLQEVAAVMTDETRDGDVVARVGGDEFVLLLKGIEDRHLLNKIAQRIIRRLSEPKMFAGKPCQISGSIGTALAGDYANPTADQLLGDADAALYAAKNAGRGKHLFFSPQMSATNKSA